MRIYILLFLFTSFFSYSQDREIDSLKRELRKKIVLKSDTNVVLIYERLANNFLNINTDSSIKYATYAIDFARQIKFDSELDKCYLFLGIATAMKGAHEQALPIYFKALSYAERYKKAKNIGIINRYAGDSYINIKQIDKSLEHYLIAQKYFEMVKDSNRIAKIYNNLGNCYFNKERYQDALNSYSKSSQLSYNLHNLNDVLISNANIGNTFLYLGKEKEGLALINKRLNSFDDKNLYQKVLLIYNLAHYYNKIKQYSLSNNWAKQGLDIATKNNFKNEIYLLSDQIYSNYNAQSNKVEAYKYLEISQKTFKENIDRTQEERLNLVTLGYEFEKLNDKKILQEEEFNQRKNTFFVIIIGVLLAALALSLIYYRRLISKNREIESALLKGQTTERKRVATELHDNLGSQISAMRWSMLAMNKDLLSDSEQEIYEQVLSMMDNSYNQIRNLSHNLMPAELEKGGLQTTMRRFIDKLNRNEKIKFDLQFKNFSDRLSPKIEFELYVISLELINNILKHSKASKAKVIFEKTDKKIEIEISDNGTGINPKMLENGTGLQNITARIQASGGLFNITNNKGLMIKVDVPLINQSQ